MNPRFRITAAAAVILGCSAPPGVKAAELAPELKVVRAGGFSLAFGTTDFAEVRIEKVKKETEPGKDGPADGGLALVARNLRRLLREHPRDLERWHETTKLDIPDFPYNDPYNSIVSKFQYLDFRSGSGILFLTQYSNEMEPNPVNNCTDMIKRDEEGKYLMQGARRLDGLPEASFRPLTGGP